MSLKASRPPLKPLTAFAGKASNLDTFSLFAAVGLCKKDIEIDTIWYETLYVFTKFVLHELTEPIRYRHF
jgi:hypothetical protein